LLAVDESFVQVDIEDLCSVFNLVLGHLQGRLVISLLDKLLELYTTRNIASLTHINEGDNWREEEFSQA